MNKLILMVGPSGASKTTTARNMVKAGNPSFSDNMLDMIMRSEVNLQEVRVCSADNYFVKNGVYYWSSDQLDIAHFLCQNRAYEAMKASVSLVIIDNTNLTERERSIYIKLAKMWGYEVTYMVVGGGTASWDAAELAARNLHGVPVDGIRRQISKYEPPAQRVK